MQKTEDHIGDLHACVVDVVLDFNAPAGVAQEPAERVAQDGVAQVPDVRGLVRIDARVFDESLGRIGSRCGSFAPGLLDRADGLLDRHPLL